MTVNMFREIIYDYGLVTFNEFPVLTIYEWGPPQYKV